MHRIPIRVIYRCQMVPFLVHDLVHCTLLKGDVVYIVNVCFHFEYFYLLFLTTSVAQLIIQSALDGWSR